MRNGGLPAARARFDAMERKAFLASKYLIHNLRQLAARTGEKTTLFVAGHQRSGTNLLMDVLERSYETDVYHERDDRAFDNYRMRELPIIRNLYDHSRSRCFVIKALCELQDLPELMDRLAPARTVWVVRNYRDVVNSAVRSFPDFVKQARFLANDPDAAGWRGQGMSPETRAIARAVVQPEITEASAAALQWYVRNVLFFERGLDRDTRVLLVAYENLVMQPLAEFRRIFGFAGLKFAPWMAGKTFATSIGKDREPDIDAAICRHCDALTARFRALMPPAR